MAKDGSVMSNRQSRLGTDSWISAALADLEETGSGQVSLPRLSDRLNVTKGSFYAHFRTRDQLLDGIATTFAERLRATSPHFVTDPDIAPERKAQRLLERDFGPYDPTHRIFAQLQRWDGPANAVEAIAEARIHHIGLYAHILAELGHNDPEAYELAAAIHATYTGYWALRTASPTAEVVGLEPAAYQRILGSLVIPTTAHLPGRTQTDRA